MTILIAALSGRALVASAHRAGARAIVTDLFGDLDTRALAPWFALSGDLARGIDRARLHEMLQRLPAAIDGIVYGSGFERAPELLDELAAAAPLLGNRPATVALLKHEERFAALLTRLGLPHPDIAAHPRGAGWLSKERGGSGGTHIQDDPMRAGTGVYFQRVAPGTPVSALFLADGREARIVGFSQQWTAPTKDAPFRYGGCAGPLDVPRRLAASIAEACSALAAATGLVGLNSLDLMVDGDAFTIIELNPRPGATLDVFDVPPLPPLWRCHCDAVAGRLASPEALAALPPPRAAAIVYAPRALRVPGRLAWPAWAADLPAPGTVFAPGDPVCTVRAGGASVPAACTLAGERAQSVLAALEPASPALSESA